MALAILAWQVTVYIGHRDKVEVKILVLPNDSSLTIDGQATKPGKKYLTKGDHRLVAARQDFDNDVKTISTSDITKNEIIYMLPAANSAAAKQYLLQHPEIQKQREAAGGIEAARVQTLLLKQYPIISKLPQETLHYKIDYSLDPNQKLSLVITTFAVINRPSQYSQYATNTQAYRQEALGFLKQNGVSANTYPISYKPSL